MEVPILKNLNINFTRVNNELNELRAKITLVNKFKIKKVNKPRKNLSNQLPSYPNVVDACS